MKKPIASFQDSGAAHKASAWNKIVSMLDIEGSHSFAARLRRARVMARRGVVGAAVAVALLGGIPLARAGDPIKVDRVVAGNARFDKIGPNTVIHASDHSIINYSQFNIPLGTSVQFVQPGANATVLNRINSATPSRIDGALTANGIVYLVNPAGVMFGANSVINVGQLYAAAAHMSDADFLSGANRFTGVQGKVINQGLINANSVNLIGQSVVNSGSIVAAPGTVAMVAGDNVYLGQRNGGILVQISSNPSSNLTPPPGTVGIDNQGTIKADLALMSSGDVYSTAIRQTGSTQARDITLQGGRQGVVQISGNLDASSPVGTGGSVKVFGSQVSLQSATINASGPTGGGNISVGGNAHGAGPNQNAAVTYVSSDSTLHADAKVNGNGGNVVVWSDQATGFFGLISARGGPQSGNAGFVEVSSAKSLVYRGNTDLSAPHGLTGTLLLDPATITIQGGVGDGDSDGSTLLFKGNATPGQIAIADSVATVYQSEIQSQSQTANIVLNAGKSIVTNGLFINGQVVIANGNSLTLTTRNNASDGAGKIDLTASNTGVGLGFVTSGAGAININASTAADVATTGDIVVGKLTTATGAISLTAGNGNVTILSPVTTSGGSFTSAGNTFNNAGGPISTGSGDITINHTGTVTIGSGLTGARIAVTSSTANQINLNVPATAVATSSNGQTYTGNVALLGTTALVDTASKDITFNNKVDGAFALTETTGGNEAFLGLVGGGTPLASVTLNGAGSTKVSGGGITSAGGQNYNNPLVLGAKTTLADNNSADIVFGKSVNGGFDLSVATGGSIKFQSGVGTGTALTSLTTSGAGVVTLSSNVTTSAGGQDFKNAVVASSAAPVFTDTASGPITFESTLDSSSAFTMNFHTDGVATFNGAIGQNSVSGASLVFSGNSSPSAGSTVLNAGTITTGSGLSATFKNAVTLQSATTINTGTLAFASTVDGGFPLIVTGGSTTFSGKVGDTTPLASLSVSGTLLTIAGSEIKTVGGQIFNAPVTLVGDTTFSDSASGDISFLSTVDGASKLTATTDGNLNFDAAVGGTTPLTGLITGGITAGKGQTNLNGGAVTTSGSGQTYNSPVLLGAGTILIDNASGKIAFNSTLDGPFDLTTKTDTAVALTSAVGASQALNSITIEGFSSTGNGSSTISTDVNTAGGGQTYLNPVALTGPVNFIDSSAGALTLNKVDAGALNLTTDGLISINGSIGSTTPLTQFTTQGYSAPSAGQVQINTASITTAGGTGQEYHNPVSLLVSTGLTDNSTGAITFDSTIDGANALTLTTDTGITLGGMVGASTPLTSLVTQGKTAASAGSLTLNTASISTAGSQDYKSPVVLAASTLLTDSASGPITFESTIDGPWNLELNTAGATNLKGIIGGTTPLANLTVDGSVNLGASAVTTTAGQTYTGAVTLAGNQTLTDSAGSNILFSSTVDGGFKLTTNTSGATIFSAPVGATTPLTTLTTGTSGTGTTAINGGTVATSSGQAYQNAVTLGANTVLNDSGGSDIVFSKSIDGAFSLALNTAGNEVFNGLVGSNTPLSSLITDDTTSAVGGLPSGSVKFAAGGSSAAPSVTTTGTQTYHDNVLLVSNTQLTSTAGGNILLLNSTNGPFALGIDTSNTTGTAGVIQFGNGAAGQAIGSAPASYLASLTTSATGLSGFATTTFQLATGSPASPNVNTTGPQTYNNPVILGSDVYVSTVGGTVAFNHTVDSDSIATPRILNIATAYTGASPNAAGGDIFFGNFGSDYVGGTSPLLSLTTLTTGKGTGSDGVTHFSMGDTSKPGVTTLKAQHYQNAVALATPTLLVTSGDATGPGSVKFDSTIDGGSLNVDASYTGPNASSAGGVIQFGIGGASYIGSKGVLASLTTTSLGKGGGAPGNTIFQVGDLVSPTVTTSGAQTYNNPVVLASDVNLVSVGDATGPGSVWFKSTLDSDAVGARNLWIDASYAGPLTNAAGGSIQFGNAGQNYVGSIHPLASLTTRSARAGSGVGIADGNTIFDMADTALDSVTTIGNQIYNHAVVLNTNTVLTSTGSGAITFASTVDASATGGSSLAVNTAGVTTFDAPVGKANQLSSLTTDKFGATHLNASEIDTTAFQTYNDPVLLLSNVTLNSSATGNLQFSQTVDGPFALVANTQGTAIFLGAVGSTAPLTTLTTDLGGTTDINGGSVATTSDQTYNDAVLLSANTGITTINSGKVWFKNTLDSDGLGGSPWSLTIDTSNLGGAAGNIQFGIGGAQNVGAIHPLLSLTTTALGNASPANDGKTIFDIVGGTTLTTTSTQTYQNPVQLQRHTALSSTSGGTIWFQNTVDGDGNGPWSFAIDTSNPTGAAGNIQFGIGGPQYVGSIAPLLSLTTTAKSVSGTADGNTYLNIRGSASPSITTKAGGQTYNNPVVLLEDATLTDLGGAVGSSGAITFQNNISGAYNLAVNTAGTTSFNGVVGASSPLTSLTTDAAGNTVINAGTVNTIVGQTYNDPVVLASTTTLNDLGSASILFNNTLDGPFDLTINTAGPTRFNAPVGSIAAVKSITTDAPGTTIINGGTVTTTAGQTYNDSVSLASDTLFTDTGSSDITFKNTLDGTFNLTVHTAGVTAFDGKVGSTTPLKSITTDAPGSTDINGGFVTTTSGQTYNDAVVLTADTTLTDTGKSDINFNSTLNGGFNLAINTGGSANFKSGIGNTTPLKSITTGSSGVTDINGGSVSTTSGQTYNNPVVLSADATLSDSGATSEITFNSTLDGPFAFAVSSAGSTRFNAPVGQTTPLKSILVNSGGLTYLNAGTVTTTHGQTYNDRLILLSDTLFKDLGQSALTFNYAIDGTFNLTTDTRGITTLAGPVGSGPALKSITIQGPLDLLAIGVTTTSGQTYNGPVILKSNTVLTDTGSSNITFNNTLDGGFGVAINTAGTALFNAAVGETTPVASITTDAPGQTNLNAGKITTSGSQTFNDPIQLLSNTSTVDEASGNITFNNTVDGAFSLFANTSGTSANGVITFNKPVGSVTKLTFLETGPGGSTDINGGSITTTNGQTYTNLVVLSADALLTNTDLSSSSITFDRTVNGGFNLSTDANVSFYNPVGDTTPLKSLTTSSRGIALLAGNPTVTTTNGQTYNNPVQIGENATLTDLGSSNITFNQTIDSQFNLVKNLTINTAGTTTFNAILGGTSRLGDIITDAPGKTVLNAGTVTAASLALNDAVTLVPAQTTVDALVVTFGSTVDGTTDSAQSLSIFGADTTFDGVVGGTTQLGHLVSQSNTAPGQTTVGANVFTGGGQNYNGNLKITPTNGSYVTLSDSGNGIFTGAVDATGINLTVDTTRGQGAVILGSDVTTGSLFVKSNAAILVGNITADTNITLQPNPNVFVTHPAPGILPDDVRPANNVLNQFIIYVFGNHITSTSGTVSLSPQGRSSVPTVATIVAQQDLTISANQFSMGQNEKLTALGKLSITALHTGGVSDIAHLGDGTATLGDINALGDITITASGINFLTRPSAGIIIGSSQFFLGVFDPTLTTLPGHPPEGVDVVSFGKIVFNGPVPTYTGTGEPPRFASNQGTGSVPGYPIAKVPSTDPALLGPVGNNQYLDLHAPQFLMASSASALPRFLPAFTANNIPGPGGISSGNVGYGQSLLNQLFSLLGGADGATFNSTAISPINGNSDLGSGPNAGQPAGMLLKVQGEIAGVSSRNDAIRLDLADAVALYRKSAKGDAVNTIDLVEFLKTSSDPIVVKANSDIQQLATLFHDLDQLGLDPQDLGKLRVRILKALVPDGLTPAQLELVVMGATG